MIDKRENIRDFIAKTSKKLSNKPEMTFSAYCKLTKKILEHLIEFFPTQPIDSNDLPTEETRQHYYQSMIDKLDNALQEYKNIVEDQSQLYHFEELVDLTEVNIKQLITELTINNPNEVILYKLKKDLRNTFENSEILKGFGLSISADPKRTKAKRTSIGYRSEFIGLNLTINMGEKIIVLPIECQIQAMEQLSLIHI